MARRTNRAPKPIETTVRSKWVVGGNGQVRDAFPLPPALKLTLDGLMYGGHHLATVAATIVFIITGIKYNLLTAIFTTFMFILMVSALKFALKYLQTNVNIAILRARRAPTVPLDKKQSPKSAINLLTSVLIGGLPGKGKSNTVWLIIDRLNHFHIPYELYVADPKGGIELSDLRDSPNTVRYVDNPNDVEDLVIHTHMDMNTRFQEMHALKLRKIPFPTEEFPLRILIIDELLLCRSQLKEGALSRLGNLLTSGRAASTIVIANTQLGQKTTLGDIRDLFPQRICFGTRTSDATDAILGDGATKQGAPAHLLSNPGQGFVYIEDNADFIFFNSPEITDTRAIAQFNAIQPTNTHDDYNTPSDTQPIPIFTAESTPDPITHNKRSRTKAATYRLYAYDDALLYVGKALNPSDRINQHKNQPWWEDVVHSKTVIKWYPSEQDAHQAELYAIKTERPIYNIQGNQTIDDTDYPNAGDL